VNDNDDDEEHDDDDDDDDDWVWTAWQRGHRSPVNLLRHARVGPLH